MGQQEEIKNRLENYNDQTDQKGRERWESNSDML